MFKEFQQAIIKHFEENMKQHPLFLSAVPKDDLWDIYLNSFPDGSNPIYKERGTYDCQCCKQFIRTVGGVVAVVDGKKINIWDVKVPEPFQTVADALSAAVNTHNLRDAALFSELKIGKLFNVVENEDTTLTTFEHFFLEVPKNRVMRNEDIATKLSELRSTKDVFHRALSEIKLDAIDAVLDLITSNNLYRGEEHLFAVRSFLGFKQAFDKAEDKDLFSWTHSLKAPASVNRIRSTVVGTLLVDISEGSDIESAVKSFEAKVAPANYKRPTAIVTQAQINAAQAKLEELGLITSLERRYATLNDISVNNIIYVSRDTRPRLKEGGVFDTLTPTVASVKTDDNFKNAKEIGIEDFIKSVIPKTTSLEVLFTNEHTNKLVSLIAPVHADAKNMFKWDNAFSWSYSGDLADSIKERVKTAGGKVDGYLRCSLAWFNTDDLDLHMSEPNGNEIYFRSKLSYTTGGELDVDMNARYPLTRNPVENICYPDKSKIKEGSYKLMVNNYNKRESSDVGFDVEIEFEGSITKIHYDKAVVGAINVAELKYTRKDGFKIISSLPSTQTSKEVWGIRTMEFRKVNVLMYSPNYWDEQGVGNRHYFFMLDGCKNSDKARGFYNEFLKEELDNHKRVLELIASKHKVAEDDNQLSGLGFSSTQRNSIICRVETPKPQVFKVLI